MTNELNLNVSFVFCVTFFYDITEAIDEALPVPSSVYATLPKLKSKEERKRSKDKSTVMLKPYPFNQFKGLHSKTNLFAFLDVSELSCSWKLT
ncbi:hypothetical protein F8388_003259 [Cannabis sativa]|uniref:Uncharacterized protein n=1 Tax=Cannabis sativa TaxID=3483 RepID=A0A7J6FM30_CANSA|nr:hypothetical protein F8388_003259 [Cannabis sativa]KAF4370909.1 hypothetical protein G4B88_012709 [Cannabis sativa]